MPFKFKRTSNDSPGTRELLEELAPNTTSTRIERGATAIEYALMVGLIAVGIIGSVSTLRDKIVKTETIVAGQMDFRCGDIDDNGTVADAADRALAWDYRNMVPSDMPNDPVRYKRADVDASGEINATDRNMLWNARNGDPNYPLACKQ